MHRTRAKQISAPTATCLLTLFIVVVSMLRMASAGQSARPSTKVTIQNPQGLKLPEQRVQIGHIVCRVVAKEFHVPENKLDCALNLVLGEQKERSTADEANGVYTVSLEHWDEASFAISGMQLAVQRMVSRDRWQRMEREIVRSVDQVAPVDATKANAFGKSRATDNTFVNK
jgi:hypothetical protein